MATFETRVSDNGGKTYRAKIRLRGYPPQSASFNRLSDAKKWAAATETAIKQGHYFKNAEAKNHTLKEMVARYYNDVLLTYSTKEQKDRKIKLDWWNSRLGHFLLSDITHIIINEHKRAIEAAPATINKYLKNLSHVYSIAVNEWGWLDDNPMGKVKAPKLPRGRVRYLDDAEREKLILSCKVSPNTCLYTAFILALSTGMRQAELMNLYWKLPQILPTETAWGVVSLEHNVIILHQTKNGEFRRIPLVGLALDLVKQRAKIKRMDTDLLFPSPTHPQQPIELRKSWLNALERADIDDFRWHDIRHTTASYLAMNGASLAEIAEVLGHKTFAMVKRYSHLSEGHIGNVIASMNEKVFGSSIS